MGETSEDLFSDLFTKVKQIEKSMKIFQAEMDMKMKIVEKVLTTKNEQFVVLKEILEQEHALYNSVLGHWSNTGILAANGLSLNLCSAHVESNTASTQNQANLSTKTSSSAARRYRKRKLLEKTNDRLGEHQTNLNNTTDVITIDDDTTDTMDPNPISENALESESGQHDENIDSSHEKSSDPDFNPLQSDLSKKPKYTYERQKKISISTKPTQYFSKVWEYVDPQENGRVWCKTCKGTLYCSNGQVRPGINVTSVRRHLKAKHPKLFIEMCKQEVEKKNLLATT